MPSDQAASFTPASPVMSFGTRSAVAFPMPLEAILFISASRNSMRNGT
jgi:hypothetical protein